ncbi:MAG: hypothetical protein GY937_19855 [bacterium]|nr:hypothetical protein [bacterium]
MLIVLLDEPGLFVFPSVDDAVREIEPIDAESEIRAAFDETGTPYEVQWARPNKRRKALFGLFESIEPGEYWLVPAGPSDPRSLVELIQSHSDSTTPPEAKADLDALLAGLSTAEHRE